MIGGLNHDHQGCVNTSDKKRFGLTKSLSITYCFRISSSKHEIIYKLPAKTDSMEASV